jgi:hypothetical protein
VAQTFAAEAERARERMRAEPVGPVPFGIIGSDLLDLRETLRDVERQDDADTEALRLALLDDAEGEQERQRLERERAERQRLLDRMKPAVDSDVEALRSWLGAGKAAAQ